MWRYGGVLWWGNANANCIYVLDSTYDAHLYHDFTREILTGLETIWLRITYAGEANGKNRRIQLSLFLRF